MPTMTQEEYRRMRDVLDAHRMQQAAEEQASLGYQPPVEPVQPVQQVQQQEPVQPVQQSVQPVQQQYGTAGDDAAFQQALNAVDWSKIRPERTIGGTLKDAGITLANAAIGAGEGVVGLANLATLGGAGKVMDSIGYDAKAARDYLNQYKSAAQKFADREVEEAGQARPGEEGFGGAVNQFGRTLGAMWENPSTILTTAVESAPSMFLGGAVGKGAVKAASAIHRARAAEKIGEGAATRLASKIVSPGGVVNDRAAGILAGVGEGVVSGGMQAEQIRQESPDRELTPRGILSAAAAGTFTGILGRIGNKISKRLGVTDVEKAIVSGVTGSMARTAGGTAGQEFKKMTAGQWAKAVTGGAITEGLFEELPQSAQEQFWTNFALERPLWEGIGAAAAQGMAAGMVMGGAANVYAGRESKQRETWERELARREEAAREKAAQLEALVREAVENSGQGQVSGQLLRGDEEEGSIAAPTTTAGLSGYDDASGVGYMPVFAAQEQLLAAAQAEAQAEQQERERIQRIYDSYTRPFIRRSVDGNPLPPPRASLQDAVNAGMQPSPPWSMAESREGTERARQAQEQARAAEEAAAREEAYNQAVQEGLSAGRYSGMDAPVQQEQSPVQQTATPQGTLSRAISNARARGDIIDTRRGQTIPRGFGYGGMPTNPEYAAREAERAARERVALERYDAERYADLVEGVDENSRNALALDNQKSLKRVKEAFAQERASQERQQRAEEALARVRETLAREAAARNQEGSAWYGGQAASQSPSGFGYDLSQALSASPDVVTEARDARRLSGRSMYPYKTPAIADPNSSVSLDGPESAEAFVRRMQEHDANQRAYSDLFRNASALEHSGLSRQEYQRMYSDLLGDPETREAAPGTGYSVPYQHIPAEEQAGMYRDYSGLFDEAEARRQEEAFQQGKGKGKKTVIDDERRQKEREGTSIAEAYDDIERQGVAISDSPFDVNAKDLRRGDRVVIRGQDGLPDIATVRGYDDHNRMVIEDGVKYLLTPNSKVSVEGVRLAGEQSQTAPGLGYQPKQLREEIANSQPLVPEQRPSGAEQPYTAQSPEEFVWRLGRSAAQNEERQGEAAQRRRDYDRSIAALKEEYRRSRGGVLLPEEEAYLEALRTAAEIPRTRRQSETGGSSEKKTSSETERASRDFVRALLNARLANEERRRGEGQGSVAPENTDAPLEETPAPEQSGLGYPLALSTPLLPARVPAGTAEEGGEAQDNPPFYPPASATPTVPAAQARRRGQRGGTEQPSLPPGTTRRLLPAPGEAQEAQGEQQGQPVLPAPEQRLQLPAPEGQAASQGLGYPGTLGTSAQNIVGDWANRVNAAGRGVAGVGQEQAAQGNTQTAPSGAAAGSAAAENLRREREAFTGRMRQHGSATNAEGTSYNLQEVQGKPGLFRVTSLTRGGERVTTVSNKGLPMEAAIKRALEASEAEEYDWWLVRGTLDGDGYATDRFSKAKGKRAEHLQALLAQERARREAQGSGVPTEGEGQSGQGIGYPGETQGIAQGAASGETATQQENPERQAFVDRLRRTGPDRGRATANGKVYNIDNNNGHYNVFVDDEPLRDKNGGGKSFASYEEAVQALADAAYPAKKKGKKAGKGKPATEVPSGTTPASTTASGEQGTAQLIDGLGYPAGIGDVAADTVQGPGSGDAERGKTDGGEKTTKAKAATGEGVDAEALAKAGKYFKTEALGEPNVRLVSVNEMIGTNLVENARTINSVEYYLDRAEEGDKLDPWPVTLLPNGGAVDATFFIHLKGRGGRYALVKVKDGEQSVPKGKAAEKTPKAGEQGTPQQGIGYPDAQVTQAVEEGFKKRFGDEAWERHGKNHVLVGGSPEAKPESSTQTGDKTGKVEGQTATESTAKAPASGKTEKKREPVLPHEIIDALMSGEDVVNGNGTSFRLIEIQTKKGWYKGIYTTKDGRSGSIVTKGKQNKYAVAVDILNKYEKDENDTGGMPYSVRAKNEQDRLFDEVIQKRRKERGAGRGIELPDDEHLRDYTEALLVSGRDIVDDGSHDLRYTIKIHTGDGSYVVEVERQKDSLNNYGWDFGPKLSVSKSETGRTIAKGVIGEGKGWTREQAIQAILDAADFKDHRREWQEKSETQEYFEGKLREGLKDKGRGSAKDPGTGGNTFISISRDIADDKEVYTVEKTVFMGSVSRKEDIGTFATEDEAVNAAVAQVPLFAKKGKGAEGEASGKAEAPTAAKPAEASAPDSSSVPAKPRRKRLENGELEPLSDFLARRQAWQEEQAETKAEQGENQAKPEDTGKPAAEITEMPDLATAQKWTMPGKKALGAYGGKNYFRVDYNGSGEDTGYGDWNLTFFDFKPDVANSQKPVDFGRIQASLDVGEDGSVTGRFTTADGSREEIFNNPLSYIGRYDKDTFAFDQGRRVGFGVTLLDGKHVDAIMYYALKRYGANADVKFLLGDGKGFTDTIYETTVPNGVVVTVNGNPFALVMAKADTSSREQVLKKVAAYEAGVEEAEKKKQDEAGEAQANLPVVLKKQRETFTEEERKEQKSFFENYGKGLDPAPPVSPKQMTRSSSLEKITKDWRDVPGKVRETESGYVFFPDGSVGMRTRHGLFFADSCEKQQTYDLATRVSRYYNDDLSDVPAVSIATFDTEQRSVSVEYINGNRSNISDPFKRSRIPTQTLSFTGLKPLALQEIVPSGNNDDNTGYYIFVSKDGGTTILNHTALNVIAPMARRVGAQKVQFYRTKQGYVSVFFDGTLAAFVAPFNEKSRSLGESIRERVEKNAGLAKEELDRLFEGAVAPTDLRKREAGAGGNKAEETDVSGKPEASATPNTPEAEPTGEQERPFDANKPYWHWTAEDWNKLKPTNEKDRILKEFYLHGRDVAGNTFSPSLWGERDGMDVWALTVTTKDGKRVRDVGATQMWTTRANAMKAAGAMANLGVAEEPTPVKEQLYYNGTALDADGNVLEVVLEGGKYTIAVDGEKPAPIQWYGKRQEAIAAWEEAVQRAKGEEGAASGKAEATGELPPMADRVATRREENAALDKEARDYVQRGDDESPSSAQDYESRVKLYKDIVQGKMNVPESSGFAMPDTREGLSELAQEVEDVLREKAPADWQGDIVRTRALAHALWDGVFDKDNDATYAAMDLLYEAFGIDSKGQLERDGVFTPLAERVEARKSGKGKKAAEEAGKQEEAATAGTDEPAAGLRNGKNKTEEADNGTSESGTVDTASTVSTLREDNGTVEENSAGVLGTVSPGLRGNAEGSGDSDTARNSAGSRRKYGTGNLPAGAGRNAVSAGRRAGSREVYNAPAGTRRRRGEQRGNVTELPANIPAQNFAITPELGLGEGGPVQKFNNNLAAIRTLKQIQAEGRRATPEEQAVLAKYVGWGGIPDAFRNAVTGEIKKGWENRVEELEALLTPEELKAALDSVLNAHYTSQDVVQAIWQGMEQLGFRGGLVLEPSVGAGNFLGLLPQNLVGETRFVAAELDNITAGIAQLLYPHESIYNTPFESLALPSNYFDAMVGNPPFGNISLTFPNLPSINRFSMHNQFVLASLDALAPGGLQAFVVSRFLMDAQKSTDVRKMIADQANLLGAIRLPGTAFLGNANTEVVTDLIFLQKKTKEEQEKWDRHRAANGGKDSIYPDWVFTQSFETENGEKLVVNRWFGKHPEHVLGEMNAEGKMNAKGDLGVTYSGNDFGKDLMQKVKELLPNNVAVRHSGKESSENAYLAMMNHLDLSLADEESGSISFNDDGQVVQVYDQRTKEGDSILTERVLDVGSPWKLEQDYDGRWFEYTDKVDENGRKVKVVKTVVDKETGEKIQKTTNYNVKEEKYYQEDELPVGRKVGETLYKKIQAAINLIDLTQRQRQLEGSFESSDEEIESNRTKLNAAYDAFVKKYGYLNASTNSFLDDVPNGPLIMALESSYRKKRGGMPERAKKSAILSRRVIFPYKAETRASGVEDALGIVLSEDGRVDLARMGELLGKDEQAFISEMFEQRENPLIFQDPERGKWVTAGEYLGGNVRRKLNAAKAALKAAREDGDEKRVQQMEKNVRALEAVQPEPWPSSQIKVIMGASWIPLNVYEEFFSHLTGESVQIDFFKQTSKFFVNEYNDSREHSGKYDNWSTRRRSAADLFTAILNSRTLRILDSEGHLDVNATEEARIKTEQMKEEFSNWIFADTARRQRLTEIFNDNFNVIQNKQYDGSHLKMPGKVPDEVIKLRRNQVNAVWRGIIDRFVLYDHVVGAGKTFTGIARAMERKRMGLSRKPMIIVPNHLVGQFTADVYRLYPGANVLSAAAEDASPVKRRKLFARIATGDWDIVIMPHSSFEFISIDKATEERFIKEELEVAKAALQEQLKRENLTEQDVAAAEGGGKNKPKLPPSVKEAVRFLRRLEERLKKLLQSGRNKDKLMTFEQMGIDDLTVDEAHLYKNLFYHSAEQAAGMGNKAGSNRAFDLYNKVRVLRENGGSVAFMTGTPVSNSAVELYTMMRYLAAEELRESGLENFDDWRRMYVEIGLAFEPNETGTGLKAVTRLGREWNNMRSMMDMYRLFADTVSNDDIQRWYKEDTGKDFPLPRVRRDESGNPREVVPVKPTPRQMEEIQRIADELENVDDISDINIRMRVRFRLMDQARKISLDIRALYPTAEGEAGGKLDQASDRIARIYREYDAVKGTQLVFLDRSVPHGKGDEKDIVEYKKLLDNLEKAERDGDSDKISKLEERIAKIKLKHEDISEMLEAWEAQKQHGKKVWNGYQQIKDNLIRLGIPANEIRFVQEAKDDTEKQALFEQVRNGEVRVLIGSTAKMGAGTNVQDRLVALHHIDVGWKPSDIEQREGRIIRQGNLFATETIDGEANPLYDPNFEVRILAYGTTPSMDSKMWALNATKLKMIAALRQYSGEFTMEFDDSDTMSAAAVAAELSGNPAQIRRFELISQISKLEAERNAFSRNKIAAEDNILKYQQILKSAPKELAFIKKYREKAVEGLKAAVEYLSGLSITVDGQRYSGEQGERRALTDYMENLKRGVESGSEKSRVEVDGKTYTINNGYYHVIDTMGDPAPFVFKMGGETLVSRSSAKRHIAGLAKQALEKAGVGTTKDEVALGMVKARNERAGDFVASQLPLGTFTLNGIDFDLNFSAYYDHNRVGEPRLYVEFGFEQKVEGDVPFSIKATVNGVFTPSGEIDLNSLGAAFYDIQNDIEKRLLKEDSAMELQRRLENAEKSLPDVQEIAKAKWHKEGLLKERREELKAVEERLASGETETAEPQAGVEDADDGVRQSQEPTRAKDRPIRRDGETLADYKTRLKAWRDRLKAEVAAAVDMVRKLVPGLTVKTTTDLDRELGKLKGKVRHLRDADGQIVGAYHAGSKTVLLTPDADAGTVLHEIGWHAMYDWAKANAPELYRQMRRFALEAPEEVQAWVKERYGRFSAEGLLDEIGAKLFTDQGREEFENAVKSRASRRWYQRLADFFRELWGRFTGAHRADLGAYRDLTPEAAMKRLLSDILEGRRFGEQGGVRSEERGAGRGDMLVRFAKELGVSPEQLQREYDAVVAQYRDTEQWLKAPNGTDSNLNERQWVLVRTPRFKKWFGDWENDPENASKVVDENGEPKVVYHGTPNTGFTVFDNAGRQRGDAPDDSNFFSDSIEVARSYSGTRENASYDPDYDDPGNYAVFLNIRNPNEAWFEGANWDGIAYGKVALYDENGDRIYQDDGRAYFDSVAEAERYAEEQGLEDYSVEEDPDTGETTNGVAREGQRLGSDGAIIYNVVDSGSESYTTASESTVYVTYSSNQVKSATDNTGAFDPANPDIRYSFAGERGAAALDQAEEATTRLDNLAIARQMEEAGKNAKTVKLATGWERGKDGKWRYEVDDSMTSVNLAALQDGTAKLPDVLNATELFKAYPDLQGVTVEIDDSLPENTGGQYYRLIGKIGLNRRVLNADEDNVRLVLHHEVQHAIQEIEGFEQGGSLESAAYEIHEANKRKWEKQLSEEWAKLDAKIRETDERIHDLRVKYGVEEYSKDLRKRAQQGEITRSEYLERVKKRIATIPELNDAVAARERLVHERFRERPELEPPKSLSYNDALNMYRRFAGEVESRNVQTRLGMTPEQRRASLASETEDVAREDQIVLQNMLGGAAASMAKPKTGKEAAEKILGLFQTAYHGSPYRFDEFTLDNIGGGEGAQVHGWGLYFALNKEVGEQYRKKLTSKDAGIYVRGKKVNSTLARHALYSDDPVAWMRRIYENWSKEEEHILGLLETLKGPGNEAVVKMLNRELADARMKKKGVEEVALASPSEIEVRKDVGQLYRVDIPEDSEMLDEQKSFAEQPEKVRAAIERVQDDIHFRFPLDGLTGQRIYQEISGNFGYAGNDEEASKILNKHGVKGIRYYGYQDGPCAVVFDDTAIEILETYYQAKKDGLNPQEALRKLYGQKQAEAGERAMQEAGEAPGLVPHRREGEALKDYLKRRQDWAQGQKGELWKQVQKQIRETLKDKAQSGAIISIIAARAASAGISAEEYVARRGLEIRQQRGVKGLRGGFDANLYHEEGRAIISAFEEADVSTLAHELAHLFREDLERFGQKGLLETAEKWAGVQGGRWSREQEERFAEAFETYLYEGKAPTENLKGVFARFRAWLAGIYRALTGSPLSNRLSPEITRVFDALLTEGAARDVEQAGYLGGGGASDDVLYQAAAPTSNSGIRGWIDRLLDNAKPDVRDRWERFVYNFLDTNDPRERIWAAAGKDADHDIVTVERLRGKKAAAESEAFRERMVKPLLATLAKAKLKASDLEEYAHALHAPERNQRMREVNAKRYLDSLLHQMTGSEAKPFKDQIELIQKQATQAGWTSRDKHLAYLQMMDQVFADIPTRELVVQAMPDSTEREQKLKALAAKRLERTKRIKEKWDEESPRFAGMTDKEAQSIIVKWHKDSRFAKLQDAHSQLRDITKMTLAVLHEGGELSDEEYDDLLNGYLHYVPLHRAGFMDTSPVTGRITGPTGKPLKVAKGSMREVVNILPEVLKAHETAISRKHKLLAGKVLYEWALANPDAGITVESIPKEPTHDREGNIVMYPSQQEPPDGVFVKVDGKKYLLRFAVDPKTPEGRTMERFLDSIKGTDAQLGGITKGLHRITRWLAAVNTMYSPEFVISNFARDLQTALVHLNQEDINMDGLQKQVLSDIPKALRGIWQSERGKGKGKEWSNWYKDFAAHGGKVGWMQGYEGIDEIVKTIEQEMKLAGDGHHLRKCFENVKNFIESANKAVENCLRLATYKAMVERGVARDRAARVASGLTVDFTQHGKLGPQINALYLFFNASVQGTVRMGQAMAKSKRVRQIAGALAGLGFMLQMLALAGGGDDDTGEPYILGIPEYERQRSIIIMLPGQDGRYIKIPKAYGYGALYDFGAEIANSIYMSATGRTYDHAKGAMRVVSSFANSFNPVHSATVLQTIAPTLVDPAVYVAENKTWSGQPLMPEQNQFGPQKPDSQRVWKSTGQAWRTIAETANSLTGGDTYEGGLIDVSPETLEMLWDNALGSAGRFIGNVAHLPATLMQDETDISKVPFARTVTGKWSDRTISNRYHDVMERAQIANMRFKNAETLEERRRIFSGDDYILFRRTHEIDKRVKRLRNRLNQIEAAGNTAGAEYIQKQILSLQKRALQMAN